MVDQNSLEFVDNDDIKDRVRKMKRNVDVDSWNKPILEQTMAQAIENSLDENSREIIRHVLKTQVFTDGVKLYLPSVHLIPDDDDGHEIKYIKIESYDPDTWEFISDVTLNFEPSGIDNLSNDEEKNRIRNDSDDLWRAITDASLSKFHLVTNGRTLSFTHDEKMFFFDLSTGIRYKEVVEIPSYAKGLDYDYNTNEFWAWNYDEPDPTLRSFKIKGFRKNPELGSRVRVGENNYIKEMTANTYKHQLVDRKIEPRSVKKFLRHLELGSPEEQADISYPENDSEQLSLYLLMYVLHKG